MEHRIGLAKNDRFSRKSAAYHQVAGSNQPSPPPSLEIKKAEVGWEETAIFLPFCSTSLLGDLTRNNVFLLALSLLSC